MQNNRLTKMNQYGDVLYCGPRDSDSYRNMGLYARDMEEAQIELVLSKLYDLEDLIDSLQEKLDMKEKIIRTMEIVEYGSNK